MILSILLLFLVEWRLTLMMLVMLPVALLIPQWFSNLAKKSSIKRKRDEANVANVVQENIRGQLVIRTFSLQDYMLKAFEDKVQRLAKVSVRLNFLSALVGQTAYLSTVLLVLVLIGFGGYLAIKGYLTTGALFAFIALLINIANAADGLAEVMPQLFLSFGGLQRVNQFFTQPQQHVASSEAIMTTDLSAGIHFQNVHFSYNQQDLILNNISFSIKQGQKVAFVGLSGSGKSTILNLIMRFYEPDSGTITLGQHSLHDHAHDAIHANISMVLQDNYLFNSSIRENIRLGKLQATKQEIVQAAQLAHIHDFIMSLNEGYDTVVEEGGVNFSGGQQQRIALARALLRQSPLLLLDEATSALDPKTEAEVNVNLCDIQQDHSMIMITHRLAAVVNLDTIYMMQRGRIIEQGNHQDLLKKNGHYAALWQKQSGFDLSDDGELAHVTISRLKATPLFSEIAEDDLNAIAELFITEHFAEDDVILTQGETGKKFYIIVRGAVDIFIQHETGDEQAISVLETGDYFGEIALMTADSVTASVRARMPTICLVLFGEQLQHLLEHNASLQALLESTMHERLQQLSQAHQS